MSCYTEYYIYRYSSYVRTPNAGTFASKYNMRSAGEPPSPLGKDACTWARTGAPVAMSVTTT